MKGWAIYLDFFFVGGVWGERFKFIYSWGTPSGAFFDCSLSIDEVIRGQINHLLEISEELLISNPARRVIVF